MPLGVLDYLGQPFGLAIMAPKGREDVLFEFMSAFEEVFAKSVVPMKVVSKNGEGRNEEQGEGDC